VFRIQGIWIRVQGLGVGPPQGLGFRGAYVGSSKNLKNLKDLAISRTSSSVASCHSGRGGGGGTGGRVGAGGGAWLTISSRPSTCPRFG